MGTHRDWTPLETGPRPTVASFFRTHAVPDIEPARAPRSLALIRWTVAAFVLGVPLVVMMLLSVLAVPPAIGHAWSTVSSAAALPPAKVLPGSTYVSDRNGRPITRFHGEVDRTPVPLAQIPLSMRHAVVAVEGKDFYTEGGVNLGAIIRAAYVNLKSGGVEQGGSTITQQYVKNIYTDGSRTIGRKIQEALIAEKLAQELPKDEILGRYLNAVYFGQGAYGVQAAAKTFFGVPAKQLNVLQSATLAGLIAAPARFDPVLNPDAALSRRNYVLGRMATEGYITPARAAELIAKPLKVFKRKATSSAAPYFSDFVRRYLQANYGVEQTFGGGLRVKTTLDLGWQRAAQDAVQGRLGLPGDPSAALVAIDPRNGAIRAMVGGINFNKHHFNLATQAHRTTGSAFKAFTFIAALEKGISPTSVWKGPPSLIIKDPRCQTDGKPWEVHNFADESAGTMPLFSALQHSVNTIFAQVAVNVGPENVAEVAQRLGIDTKLQAVCSITLGSNAVTPMEMTEAFASIASRGIHHDPHGVEQVTSSSGKVLERLDPAGERVLSENVADAATLGLQGVVTGGTGVAAYFGRPAAGKTGTAQNFQDAWFCGFVPQLATCVWVGYPQAEIPLRYVHGISGMTGGSIPAGIWHDFMSTVLANSPIEYFHSPDLSEFTLIPKMADIQVSPSPSASPSKSPGAGNGGGNDGGGGGGGDGGGGGGTCDPHAKPRCHDPPG